MIHCKLLTLFSSYLPSEQQTILFLCVTYCNIWRYIKGIQKWMWFVTSVASANMSVSVLFLFAVLSWIITKHSLMFSYLLHDIFSEAVQCYQALCTVVPAASSWCCLVCSAPRSAQHPPYMMTAVLNSCQLTKTWYVFVHWTIINSILAIPHCSLSKYNHKQMWTAALHCTLCSFPVQFKYTNTGGDSNSKPYLNTMLICLYFLKVAQIWKFTSSIVLTWGPLPRTLNVSKCCSSKCVVLLTVLLNILLLHN
jgi:hypothetical protein